MYRIRLVHHMLIVLLIVCVALAACGSYNGNQICGGQNVTCNQNNK